MNDELTDYLANDLDGSYDCVDRLVINAYNVLCQQAAGFRFWWRRFMGSDADLDNTHLMRLAGRFSRRLRASAQAHGIPVIDCRRGERKHEIAEDYLATHTVQPGVFLVLVSRAMAMVYDVERTKKGVIRNIARKKAYVNHYSFHIVDAEWGHLAIKMAGHPPFDAQIMLNGHEYVERRATQASVDFVKEGNCFTQVTDLAGLAQCAATVSESRTVGHLVEICERWIYSSCLCFGLSLDEQEDSQFRYQYSAYQLEYSHNLLFREPAQMEAFFQALATRAWGRLNLPQLKTIFGTRARPWTPPGKAPRREFVLERPSYDLTVFKLHYGYLTLKAYTKGERVLRFEAIADHVGALRCGRIMTKFPDMVLHLKRYLARFLTALHCVNRPFIADQMLDRLPRPMQLGASRVGGIDVNAPRMRAVLAAVIALAPTPLGFSASALAATVCSMTGGQYGARQAAYDLRKLRAHDLLGKIPASRHYRPTSTGLRAMAALLVLREQLLRPLLTGSMTNEPSRQPLHLTTLDQHYEALRTDMRCLFADLGIAA